MGYPRGNPPKFICFICPYYLMKALKLCEKKIKKNQKKIKKNINLVQLKIYIL